MIVDRDIALSQLDVEMSAANLPINGLGTSGALEDGSLHIFTYDEDGASVDLPPEAAAIIAAHVPEGPPPTRAEKVDALVADGVAALASATTISQVKAAFAAALRGLGAIDGTGAAS